MRGKVVLITGSSSGIGAEVAAHFASLGCKLSLTGRNEEGLKITAQLCLSAGLNAEHIMYTVADISFSDEVQKVFDLTIEKFGQLDILINNAAIIKGFKNTLALSSTEYGEIMSVNLRAVFQFCQLAMPYLYQTGGNVVNVSSVTGQGIFPGGNVYAVSKAALDHMTRMIALEVSSKGVRVNAVSPGAIATPIWDRNGVALEAVTEAASKSAPMGRIGTSKDIAHAIEYLADDKVASFITGIVLVVDGGISLTRMPLG